jgi:pyruvate/2-oxoacid:ferredoxin oxidoreductase beta subunit
MDKNVFINVAAPTLVSAHGAPFIAITSKGTTDSFTEKLINKKRKDGTSLINHIEFDLECLKCKRKKRKADGLLIC